MSKVSNWIPDHKAEAVLNALKIPFKVVSVPISKINWKLAEKNPARTERAEDPELIEDYTAAMKKGEVFPYTIAISHKGTFFPIAGYHRTKSAKNAGLKEVIAYVPSVALTDTQVRLIAVISNRKEGKRANREEATAHAMALVFDGGLTEVNAAKLVGINEKSLNGAVQAERTKRRAMEAGSSARLSQAQWYALKPIANNDNVLHAASRAVEELGIPSADVRKLTKDIKKGRNESTQIELINQFVKDNRGTLSTTKNKNRAQVKLPLRDGYFKRVRDLTNFLKGKTLKTLQMAKGSPEHKQAIKQWKELDALAKKSLK